MEVAEAVVDLADLLEVAGDHEVGRRLRVLLGGRAQAHQAVTSLRCTTSTPMTTRIAA